ncbi:MAG TPA: NAD(P)-dependent oxidoreductase [Mycobacteriales bacterium]|nr:NAD(P)-dependent oxidoreductase [Mycobacteriales bacterium]
MSGSGRGSDRSAASRCGCAARPTPTGRAPSIWTRWDCADPPDGTLVRAAIERARQMTVAILGTGIMGTGMARNLRRAGFTVRAWNRTIERATPLEADGVTVCGSVVEAIEGAEVVLTILHDTDATEQILADLPPSPGVVWVQAATVGIEGCDRLAARAADLGWTFVDAPVLGTKAPAENGTLTVLAAGPEEARAAADPVFAAIGARTLWVGAAGAASRLKLVANAWVQALTVAAAQSIAMARGLDLDPQLFLDAISGGAADSPYAHLKGAAILNGDYTASFSIDGAAKDAALIATAAREAGINDALAATVSALFDLTNQQGHGGSDMAAVIYALQK